MVINKFSKNGKSGFSVGSNNLTPDKVAAGAVTALSALVIMAVGGVIKLFSKPSKKSKNSEKKKKPLWLLALPLIYKQVKNKARSADTKEILNGLVKKYSGGDGEPNGDEVFDEALTDDDIEVIDAIPISSEDEVYTHFGLKSV